MIIPLADRRRWLFPSSVIVLAASYLLLTGTEFVASWFASRKDVGSLERAVRLSPGNADYQDRLGRYHSFVEANPQAALDNFETAAKLNPYGANFWLDVASARHVAGNSPGERDALENAIRAEPTAPRVAWEAANFFLVDGDEQRALREFRVAIDSDGSLAGTALQYCWRAYPDVDLLLREAVPTHAWSLIKFLELLMSKKETDGTLKVWDRLLVQHEKFENRYLFEYVRYLIGAQRPDAAMHAWKDASGLLGLGGYLPTEDNLVINPDFSLDILNGGFDWNYIERNGVRLILDPSDFHQGHRSLSITFEGPGISDAGIQQIIPVHGGSALDFSAYYKSTSFEGAGGPQIALRDAYSGAPLYISDPLVDADFWKVVHSRITIPETTRLLVLRIERFPAGSPLRGKLWLDGFNLSPADTDQP
jgi:hypothetical protein